MLPCLPLPAARYHIGMMRTQGGSNMLLEAFHWLRAHHPYWCAV